MFEIPFNTHRVFITLDDNNIYEVHPDFKKTIVNNRDVIVENEPLKPRLVIHKYQFDKAKSFILNPENPFHLSREKAELLLKLNFITKMEYDDYVDSL